MLDQRDSEYLRIYIDHGRSEGRKTNVWWVENRRSGARLGEIKWYGAWRQYCFYPEANCVFNKGCLLDIQQFLKDAMEDH